MKAFSTLSEMVNAMVERMNSDEVDCNRWTAEDVLRVCVFDALAINLRVQGIVISTKTTKAISGFGYVAA